MTLREGPFANDQVSAVFGKLLPDYEPILRRAAECVATKGTDSFSLLSDIRRKCVEALRYRSLPAR